MYMNRLKTSMAVVAFMGLLSACSDNADEFLNTDSRMAKNLSSNVSREIVSHTFTFDVPAETKNADFVDCKAILINVETQKKDTISVFTKKGNQYTGELSIQEGTYNIEMQGKVKYIIDVNNYKKKLPKAMIKKNIREVEAMVKTDMPPINIQKGGDKNTNVRLKVRNRHEGLLISEIFYAHTTDPEGHIYVDDTYMKIANNSDTVIYADGLAFVETFFTSDDKHDYQPDIMSQAMTINTIYVIPGSGKEHPIQPGKEITIALTAEDHTKHNPNSIDLSKADFEICDQSSVQSGGDKDMPNVPNMLNWYPGFEGTFAFHDRGVKSYAIVSPVSMNQHNMKNFRYHFQYHYSFNGFETDMKEFEFFMPNAWVVDCVNLSVVGGNQQWLCASETLDKGYAHCGVTDFDDGRYNHSVVRKREGHNYVEEDANIKGAPVESEWWIDQNLSLGGKWIDTNNSSEDFVSNSCPTFMQMKLKKTGIRRIHM